MCLIIHKPKDAEVPDLLLRSASEFNPHGFGIMALSENHGLSVRRRSRTHITELWKLYAAYREQECVIHFRYRTRGDIDSGNTHPIRITRDIYMAHNGTLELDQHEHGRSDTWHLVNDYLRPILRHRPLTLYETAFHDLIKAWAGPSNKFVFMDSARNQTVIINRDYGFEIEGLWLSNTRWFDASKFEWHQAMIEKTGNSQASGYLV